MHSIIWVHRIGYEVIITFDLQYRRLKSIKVRRVYTNKWIIEYIILSQVCVRYKHLSFMIKRRGHWQSGTCLVDMEPS